jgi:hypothetical protein
MTLTFTEAEDLMRRARNGSRRLRRNTYLHEDGPDAYSIRYHSTDIVTVRRDGTYTLRTGGWNTVTTKARLNDYSPARIYSENNTLAVWDRANDPRTPPKIGKCRACRGTGIQHTRAWTKTHGYLDAPAYEVKDEFAWNTVHEGNTYPDLYYSKYRNLQPLMRDGQPLTDQPEHVTIAGQVTRHDTGSYWKLPVPVHHPSEPYTCHGCGGSGQRDYGSKPMPVLFFDGITVDSSGSVVNAAGLERMRESAETKAARLQATMKAIRFARRNERRDFIRQYGLRTEPGAVIMFKAVRDDLRSAHDALYAIGTTVTAPDYAPNRACGNGLHFSPAPDMARAYDGSATRFLACAVDRKTVVILGDKAKARSCRVLYEVDEGGNRLQPEIGWGSYGYRE